MSLNKAIIMGRLGQDPELKHTQGGKAVCTLSVATTEYSGKGDERKEITEWHRIVCWERTAENCAKYLAKGREVLVEGRIQTRSWEKDGEKRFSTEIVAQGVQFIGKGQDSRQGENSQQRGDLPPQNRNHEPETPGLDDIPF